MNTQEFEAFVRDRAALGWSRARVCETLGLTPAKLAHLTEGLKGIPWPAPSRGAAHRLSYEARKGCFPGYLQHNLAQAHAANVSRVSVYELCGIKASLRVLCEIWSNQISVSPSQIRRRLRAGASIYDALFAPSSPPERRNQGRKSRSSHAVR
jgi:transcriptional regulator with XRE-family HTH domain